MMRPRLQAERRITAHVWHALLGACLALSPLGVDAEWQPRVDMLFPHQAHRAEVARGRIYVLGGRNGRGNLVHEIEMYDPGADTWSHVGDMPSPRSIFGAAVWNDAIYVFGGNGAPLANLKSVVERYDPETGSWTRLTDMPIGRSAHSAQVVGDKIYVVGDSERVDRYDPATDTWSRVADIPTFGIHFPTASVNGKLYVFAGGDEADHVYQYDPAADRWRERAPRPTGRGVALSTVVGGQVYVIGGFLHAPNAGPRVVEIYDPEDDSWRTGPSTANNHGHGAAVNINGVIYALAGEVLLGAVQRVSQEVEAWDTGIRTVSPGSATALTTWGAIRERHRADASG